jgi:8-oxo-dGTP diphosphatase
VSKRRFHYDYARPSVAVDMVVLTVVDLDLKVLLIERGEPPFLGQWALPGGFVRVGDGVDEQGEDIDAAAARELREETGLRPDAVYLEQLRAFGRAGRDPRGRVISIAYYALVPADLVGRVRPGDDAADARWYSVHDVGSSTLPLAFDHEEIVAATLAALAVRIDGDLRMATSLVPAEFTKAELRRVFEVVSGDVYDKSNFNKRFNGMLDDGLIVEAPGRRVFAGPGRPAALYSFHDAP